MERDTGEVYDVETIYPLRRRTPRAGILEHSVHAVTEQAARADDLVDEAIAAGHRATYRRSVWKST